MDGSMPTTERTVKNLEEALHWRYATKLFDAAKKIPAADWQLIKDSLRLAPSSAGLQPWKFIVVEDPALRQALREASRGQAQVTDASHLVVFAYYKKVDLDLVDRYVARVAAVRGQSLEQLAGLRNGVANILIDGPRAASIGAWAQRQAYIPLGFAMLAAAQLGIDSCPMEGFDTAAFDKLLGLEGGPWAVVAALPLGYRSDEDKYGKLPKVRFEEKDVFETR
jgi:nitroreductase